MQNLHFRAKDIYELVDGLADRDPSAANIRFVSEEGLLLIRDPKASKEGAPWVKAFAFEADAEVSGPETAFLKKTSIVGGDDFMVPLPSEVFLETAQAYEAAVKEQGAEAADKLHMGIMVDDGGIGIAKGQDLVTIEDRPPRPTSSQNLEDDDPTPSP